MHATQTLHEAAKDTIQREFDRAESNTPVVLWWDDGAFLEDVVKRACSELGVHLKIAEESPLELRANPVHERQVWYVRHVKAPDDVDGDYDWFRDIEHTGGEVELSIEDLTVRVFGSEHIQAWELKNATDSDDPQQRKAIAQILYDQLTGGQLPTLEQLRTQIVTGGYTDPVAFILENGWGQIEDDTGTIDQMKDLLQGEGVNAVSSETDPAGIVTQTRRWAVAEWLIHAGVDAGRFPDGFQVETAGSWDLPSLKSVLNKTSNAPGIADEYLAEQLWPKIVAELDDPWEFASCPVEGALEHRLWDEWDASFEAGEYEACLSRAEERHEVLETEYGAESPWTCTWAQAVDIARLAHRLETWDNSPATDVVSLYADEEDGTWQIDNAVLNLVVSGEPETDLPEAHPATGSLGSRRSGLQTEYITYLEDLADIVTETVEAGAPFVEKDHAHEFFTEEAEGLESGKSVALFVIDALRLDLARQLASTLRTEAPAFAIEEQTWVGTLPSETEFGKAALTPGEVHIFDVSLVDGKLVPLRNNRRVDTNRRNSLLDADGWTVTRDREEGWQSTRVAYFQNDLDDIGEKELDELEERLAHRVETLADSIGKKLKQGEWDQAYILSDHGFVLLPDHVTPERISRPGEAEDSGRRWITGAKVDEESPGVLLDPGARLGYLDAHVSILANPLEQFGKRGREEARFFHGGLLPQEFVLDFISVTRE